jgi:hypothetical protein
VEGKEQGRDREGEKEKYDKEMKEMRQQPSS